MISMLDPAKANAPFFEELEAVASKIIRSGKYIMGPEVGSFEQNVATYLDAKYAIAVSSGTDALLLALMAYGIGVGDEVICPSFTFFATAGSISRVGATPVFADNLPNCFTIDPTSIRSLITEKTKAIMPVHLFGQSADMDAIMEIAKEHNLIVIEDACQAIGAKLNDKFVGTIGHVGCFSFFPSKNLGGLGDSGLVTTNDDAIAAKMISLRNHGSSVKYYHDYVGANFRIDTLQAAFLDIKLKYLFNEETIRRDNADRYLKKLSPACESGLLVKLPFAERGYHTYNQFTIRVRAKDRDALMKYLADNKISSAIYYPVPLHKQICYKQNNDDNLPNAMLAAQECLSLPVAGLTKDEVNSVITAILDF